MKKPIYERIREEAEAEAKVLQEEAKAEAKRILSDGKEDIIERNTSDLNTFQVQNKDRVKHYKERQEKSLVTYQEQVRQELVVGVFDEVYEKLSALKDKALLSFVTRLINSEKVVGNEVIYVSKLNFDKYLSALSGNKKADHLDLLNAANKEYKFTLSKEPTHVIEGFLLSGKEYDLIFDFKEIVTLYQKENEQRIYNELFKDE